MDNLNHIDSFVKQVKGNTTFLKKVFFIRPVAIAAIVVLGFFLVAAFAIN
jgi:hypothetical protein